MSRDQWVDGPAELAKRLMRPRFIFAHQPAEPDHVRMQDRGELALAGARFENFSHRFSNKGPNIEG